MTAPDEVVKKAAAAWKAICEDLSVTEERRYSSTDIAAKTGHNIPTGGRYQRLFKGLGILTYRSQYAGQKGGQAIFMKLVVPLDDGLTAIYRHFDAGRSFSYFEADNPGNTHKHKTRIRPVETEVGKDEPKPVIADERSREEVRAIAGPEPTSPMKALAPLRKDELEALIEAARQYTHRTDAVTKHIEELRALGVEVDVDLVMKGIKLAIDPELEAIGRVLPYIERLEKQNTRLTVENTEDRSVITGLRRESEAMRSSIISLRDANKRLSERNVALSGIKAETISTPA